MKTEKKVNYENTKANETNNRIYSLSPNNFDRKQVTCNDEELYLQESKPTEDHQSE